MYNYRLQEWHICILNCEQSSLSTHHKTHHHGHSFMNRLTLLGDNTSNEQGGLYTLWLETSELYNWSKTLTQ